ncbi:MAG: monovalent cation/H(+) antiporter subunit G [Motiliproteus sp.]
MSDWITLASGLCFSLGGFLCITGGVGLLRFPDFFSRVHAAGVTETLATPLLLSGVMLQLGWSQDSLKLLLVMAFVLATNPTAAHAMAKAALDGGLRPQIEQDDTTDQEGRSSKP